MKPLLIGLAGGVLGVALMLAAWHLWQDHEALHASINFLNAQIQAAQKAQGK